MKQWQSLSLMEQYMVMDAISAELLQAMNSLCKYCGISSDNFINSTFEVVDDNMFNVIGIYHTSYIVYSTPEGNVTSTTLVTLLQQWLLEAKENDVQVNVGEVYLAKYKPCDLTYDNPTSKLLCLTSLTIGLQAEVFNETSCIAPTPSPVEVFNETSCIAPTLSPVASCIAPTPSPVESSLSILQTHTFAVIAGAVASGILAGVICTVITALSWSAEIVMYISSIVQYILRCWFSHAVCLYTRGSQVIPLSTCIPKLR